MTKILRFAIYYIQKRLSVFLGYHRTRNPLSLRWRWTYWANKQDEIRWQARQKTNISTSKLDSLK